MVFAFDVAYTFQSSCSSVALVYWSVIDSLWQSNQKTLRVPNYFYLIEGRRRVLPNTIGKDMAFSEVRAVPDLGYSSHSYMREMWTADMQILFAVENRIDVMRRMLR